MLKRLVRLLALLVIPFALSAQETNSSISGTVKTAQGEALVGATVTATHVPTGTVYRVATRTGGRFNLYNLRPGGPYTVVVSFVGFADDKKEDIFLNLGENSNQEFALRDKSTELTSVTVSQRRTVSSGKGGTETSIGRDKMANLPNVGRGLNDYLKYTPQVKLTGDGGVAFAGQNNRYNSFFIDGSNNTDIFGLAASGTNGGQANVAPISIDAIDQIQVILSPYDAQFGNFTGGAINAVTKSGTNQVQGSAWYYFRNQNLTGLSPVPVAKTGFPSVYERTKAAKFANKTYGIRVGGPIVQNKLFYFLLAEIQRDERPQPFNLADYRGTSNQAGIDNLANFVRTNYGYEPGGYLDNPEKVNADRINAKLDWNINDNNRLSLSYRYNKGLRYNTSSSSSTTINFYNNGFLFPNLTNSISAELKSTLKNNTSNRLLVTLTDEVDDRGPIGQPFPRVSIFDGSAGTIVFGTENFSAANLLKAKNLTILDAVKFYKGKHVITVGTDNEFNDVLNTFIRDNYGTYTYNTLNDFYTGARPRTYTRTFSLIDNGVGDNTIASAKFKTARIGFFVTDEVKVNDNFTLVLGLRVDRTELLTKPLEDKFFNDTALAKITPYYDLHGARSGQTMDPRWMISPRVGFTYKIPDEGLVFRGGMGIFSGRVPLVWPGGIYNNNGVSLGGFTVNNPAITFNPDPFNQPNAAALGQSLANSKGQIDLVAKDFRLPTVFRTSLAMDKKLGDGWTFTTEAIFTKNIWEIEYVNVNIVTPIGKSLGPDSRNVYSAGSAPTRIPMRSTGANPYQNNIYLLQNNEGRRGYSYSLTFTIDKAFRNGFAFNANYTYGNSVSLNEGTSSQNNSQWRFMESVNGRNQLELSTSDFDLGHRINAFVSKQFEYANKKMSTTISLVYNGQSGSPYSYVYRGSPVNDQASNENNDLMYIPTSQDLAGMTFLSNTVSGITYTAQQQKDMLEAFIQGDKYLRKNRGKFAERNGARLPFTNNLDLKLEQKFNVKMSGRRYTLSVTYDVYNFTNMMNKDWGRTWFLANDNFSLVSFAGFVSATNLTPQYRFNPIVGKPWGVSTSLSPGYTARWISQLGVRLTF